jgi:hypothetical protein
VNRIPTQSHFISSVPFAVRNKLFRRNRDLNTGKYTQTYLSRNLIFRALRRTAVLETSRATAGSVNFGIFLRKGFGNIPTLSSTVVLGSSGQPKSLLIGDGEVWHGHILNRSSYFLFLVGLVYCRNSTMIIDYTCISRRNKITEIN